MAKPARGGVDGVVKRQVVGVQAPSHVIKRFREQAAEANLPNGAFFCFLVEQYDSNPTLETPSDYVKTIQHLSSLLASISGAAVVKFGSDWADADSGEEELPDAA